VRVPALDKVPVERITLVLFVPGKEEAQNTVVLAVYLNVVLACIVLFA
jgi:hypothetical protein